MCVMSATLLKLPETQFPVLENKGNTIHIMMKTGESVSNMQYNVSTLYVLNKVVFYKTKYLEERFLTVTLKWPESWCVVFVFFCVKVIYID